MVTLNNLNELIDKLNNHKADDPFSSFFVSPEEGSEAFLLNDKDVLSFSSTGDKHSAKSFVYRKYAGVLLCLFPNKYIYNNMKAFKSLRKNINEKLGSFYQIIKEYNPYRENNLYYHCYIVDGNKINIVLDPYQGVLILNYFGGDAKLCNDTKTTFEIVGQAILDTIKLSENVSQIQ